MKLSAAITTASVAASILVLGACAPVDSPSTVRAGDAGTVQPVQFGTLTAMRSVEIRPGQTRVGTIAGATLGAIGGSQIGSSTAANVAGSVSGAVAGGAVGSAIEGSGRANGLELTIQLDSGETVAVVQPGNANDFRVGDRVRITGTDDNARVTR